MTGGNSRASSGHAVRRVHVRSPLVALRSVALRRKLIMSSRVLRLRHHARFFLFLFSAFRPAYAPPPANAHHRPSAQPNPSPCDATRTHSQRLPVDFFLAVLLERCAGGCMVGAPKRPPPAGGAPGVAAPKRPPPVAGAPNPGVTAGVAAAPKSPPPAAPGVASPGVASPGVVANAPSGFMAPNALAPAAGAPNGFAPGVAAPPRPSSPVPAPRAG